MTRERTVGGDASLRLFCALTLPATVRNAIASWQRSLPQADARRVAGDNLHITLAFLGRRPTRDVEPVSEALRVAVAAVGDRPRLRLARYRETGSVAMLVFEDDGGETTRLASVLHEGLEALGVYEREARPFLPHVTVLRYRLRPRLRPKLPDLAPFSPSEAAVYHSLLRRGGAQYVMLDSVSLGG